MISRNILLPVAACLFGLVSLVCGDDGKPAESNIQRSGLVAPGDFIWGMNGHPPSGGGTYSDDRGVPLSEQLRLLKELGVTWYRFDVFARDRVPGVWEGRDELDAIVPVTEAAGIKILPTLYPPMEMRPYATLHQRMKPEEIYKKCYEHAKTAAAKWRGRVKVWDLLNEPDGWTMREPAGHGLSKGDYSPMRIQTATMILKGQADGIREGDPNAKISLNTGGWLHTGFVDHMVDGGVPFDILSWHWYSEMGQMDRVKVADEAVNGYPLLDKLIAYGKPIWIGETHCRPGNPAKPEERVAWLKAMTEKLFAMRNKGVEAIFYYELLDLPAEAGDAGYGFIPLRVRENSGSLKKYEMAAPPWPQFDELRLLIQDVQKTGGRQ